MSNELGSLLDNLYRTSGNQSPAHLEKTAEANLLAQLRGEGGQASEDPYANLSLEQLLALQAELEGSEKTASAEGVDEELEKTAAEMLGGQVMAHAMYHEFGLIKEAMANGLCRVCKEHPMDVEGSSICSACASA